MNRSILHRNGFGPLVFAFQTSGRLSGSPISKSCIVIEIHSRSLPQRLRNWSKTFREDRNGKSTNDCFQPRQFAAVRAVIGASS